MRITNRDASEKLGVKLAKWKRWSREFLPPDPGAGMQAGYAREYGMDECFTVYLGGHLVSKLKFSVPDSKRILEALIPWMKEKGFLPLEFYANEDTEPSWGLSISVHDEVAIMAKGIIENLIVESPDEYDGPGTVCLQRYISELVGDGMFNSEVSRNLEITTFVFKFIGEIRQFFLYQVVILIRQAGNNRRKVMRNVQLKRMIFEAELTQREIARKTNIPENLLSMAIHGRFILDPVQRLKIAQILNKSVNEIFVDQVRGRMMPTIPELLTARDVQRILKCSLPLVYKMAERAQLPCVRWEAPGNGTRKKTVIRFKFADVQKFIEGAYNGG